MQLVEIRIEYRKVCDEIRDLVNSEAGDYDEDKVKFLDSVKEIKLTKKYRDLIYRERVLENQGKAIVNSRDPDVLKMVIR